MKNLPSINFKNQLATRYGMEILPLDFLQRREKSPSDPDPFQPHRVKFYALFFIIGGKIGLHYIDFKEYKFSKNNVILVAKEQVQAFMSTPENEGYLMLFTEKFLIESISPSTQLIDELYNNQLYHPVIAFEETKFSELCHLLEKVSSEIKNAEKSTRFEIARSYFKILLLEIMHGRKKEKSKLEGIPYLEDFLLFQRLLKSNIQSEKKVNYYAKAMHITPRKLNTITRSLVHVSAKEYITQAVVLEAKRYLKASHLTITETAYQLGFEEPTNFTKFFRKHSGVSPSDFIAG